MLGRRWYVKHHSNLRISEPLHQLRKSSLSQETCTRSSTQWSELYFFNVDIFVKLHFGPTDRRFFVAFFDRPTDRMYILFSEPARKYILVFAQQLEHTSKTWSIYFCSTSILRKREVYTAFQQAKWSIYLVFGRHLKYTPQGKSILCFLPKSEMCLGRFFFHTFFSKTDRPKMSTFEKKRADHCSTCVIHTLFFARWMPRNPLVPAQTLRIFSTVDDLWLLPDT